MGKEIRVDMQGRVCIVTGATNGIGEVTARELAARGATTLIIGRNEEKCRRTTEQIKNQTGNNDVHYLVADLSSMAEIRQVAAAFKARFEALHVLVNNAGAMFESYQKTVDGYEMTFALNHLNYFLLTHLLLDALRAGATPQRKARVVNVSSDAHQMARLNFNNLQAEKGYNSFVAYGVSKLQNIMFTYELARRLQAEGANISVNALHPGFVATGFGRNNGFLVNAFFALAQPFARNADDGARTSVYLATAPEVEAVTGQYFLDCKPKASNRASMNPADWQRLWEISEALTGLKEGVAI